MQALSILLPQLLPFALFVSALQVPEPLQTGALRHALEATPQTVPATWWLAWHTPAWQVSALVQALFTVLPQAVPLGLLVGASQVPEPLQTLASVQGPPPPPQTVPAGTSLAWQTPAWQVLGPLQGRSSCVPQGEPSGLLVAGRQTPSLLQTPAT